MMKIFKISQALNGSMINRGKGPGGGGMEKGKRKERGTGVIIRIRCVPCLYNYKY